MHMAGGGDAQGGVGGCTCILCIPPGYAPACPVQPLLRLSLVGSQPMGTLLGELENPISCACAAGKLARSSRYSGCHWSAHSQ